MSFIRFAGQKGTWPFIAFWIVGISVIVGRLVFDVRTYFFGSTLCYYTSGSGYDYLLHLPKGYTDFAGPRPLIIYLHGAGETGISLQKLKERDLVHCVKGNIGKEDFPFIVVCPLTNKHGWEPQTVILLLEDFIADKSKRWRVNERKAYLTGFSMGGFGTFRTACAYPERFAAIAPVAGGGDLDDAGKLVSVPTWAFHGDADDVVPFECSSRIIEAIYNTGNKNAKLTMLEEAGHGITGEVYTRPELYIWLSQQNLPL